MASSVKRLIPPDPEKVMVLRRVAPTILTCSTPFLRAGYIKIGGRGTVVQLQTGNLAVFSPVALTPTLQRELSTMGTGKVSYIAALDQEHHIFISEWHKYFPEARVLAPDTLPVYREKQGYDKLPAENWVLFKDGGMPVSPEFDAEFESVYLPEHVNKELVFCHKPTRTLIEADLMFNMPATEQFSRVTEKSGMLVNSLTRAFQYFTTTNGENPPQQRMASLIARNDPAGFSKHVKTIASWGFDRMIPCHGDVIETGGLDAFKRVFKAQLAAYPTVANGNGATPPLPDHTKPAA
ncbi:hypothetical protein K470DRAFT_259230 [Piedraia hortae CBS 480.64]|uniref:Uncharacterized protein n=1 Tax=Piedraia hortae CBS 480.64 TaxID=1314780 RepID=A0A6A7BWE8_9PEZI|nr:hypothetical protein K470DRAFT_259230 [Piedraia hortae CBS 480.64]